jgi:hypothetical protein
MHVTDTSATGQERLNAMLSTAEVFRSRVKDVLKQLEVRIWSELMEGLIAANACCDYLSLSREAVARFPDDEVFPSEVANAESWFAQREEILKTQNEDGEMSEEVMSSTLVNGSVYPTAYPWMTDGVAARDEDCVQGIKRDFENASNNSIVARSTLRNAVDDDTSSPLDVLGVVATRDISLNETILVDSTVATATTGTTRCPICCGIIPNVGAVLNPCCDVGYCSPACASAALETFHPVLCGKDFSFLSPQVADSTSLSHKLSPSTLTDLFLDNLLLLRVLALTLHSPSSASSPSADSSPTHPLLSPLLSRLTPAYSTTQPVLFNLRDHIITPILILGALGVDVFADPLYDTWVLLTLIWRVRNNRHAGHAETGDGDGEKSTAVHPLYSMLNHSCSPNLSWEHVEEEKEGVVSGDLRTGGTKIRLLAARPIEKGEELYISYLGAAGEEMELEERQQALRPWLGMECGCVRCVTERQDEEEAEEDEEDEEEKMADGGHGE